MVEIIPKKSKIGLPVGNLFLFMAGALLIAVILSYAVLIRVETKALLAVQDLEGSILKIGTPKDRAAESMVFLIEEKIRDFKNLLASRQYSSNFFDNFGALIHPKILFSSFELDLQENRAVVSGSAADFKTLEQQLIFLKSRSDLVESFQLSNIILGSKGAVNFNFIFNFTQKIYE